MISGTSHGYRGVGVAEHATVFLGRCFCSNNCHTLHGLRLPSVLLHGMSSQYGVGDREKLYTLYDLLHFRLGRVQPGRCEGLLSTWGHTIFVCSSNFRGGNGHVSGPQATRSRESIVSSGQVLGSTPFRPCFVRNSLEHQRTRLGLHALGDQSYHNNATRVSITFSGHRLAIYSSVRV